MIQLYIYIYFHILFHYSLSQDIEYSSLCYTVGLNQLSLSIQRTDMEKKLEYLILERIIKSRWKLWGRSYLNTRTFLWWNTEWLRCGFLSFDGMEADSTLTSWEWCQSWAMGCVVINEGRGQMTALQDVRICYRLGLCPGGCSHKKLRRDLVTKQKKKMLALDSPWLVFRSHGIYSLITATGLLTKYL